MKRICLFLLCLTQTVSVLAAAEAPFSLDSISPIERGLAPPVLLAEIQGVASPGELSVTVSYLREGELFYREIIQFEAAGRNPVLELLPWSPQERSSFVDGSGGRSVILEHPNGSVQSLRLGDILETTSDLLSSGRPLATTLAVTGTKSRARDFKDIGRIFASAGSCDRQCCYNNCYSYYSQCESGCGTAPAEDCLERCDAELNSCLSYCDRCPVITEWTVTTVTSETAKPGQLCLQDHRFPSSSGKWYYKYQRSLQHTTYRKTESCSGSTTTEVVNVSYSTDTCWKWSPNSCGTGDPTSYLYCRYY